MSTMVNLQFLSQSVGMTLLSLQRPLWSLKQQHLRWLLKLHVPSRLLTGDQRDRVARLQNENLSDPAALPVPQPAPL